MTCRILVGDCRERMAEMEPNSVDAIVTDPPYDLTSISRNGSPRQNNPEMPHGRHRLQSAGGFMGMAWDGTGVAFDPETWRAALHVLKPGGHLLAFGGTRTYHRMVCAIEDAGFEIRDQLAWMYATGFPKSLDVSKAIDKAAGAERTKILGVAADFARDEAERKTNGSHVEPGYSGGFGDRWAQPITAPATPEAARWQGWGTALKPAFEPICVARKSLIGSVAANVTTWGTGGLNIGACRIEWVGDPPLIGTPGWGGPNKKLTVVPNGDGATVERTPPNELGRWPANVVLDEIAAAELDEQSGEHPGCKSPSTARVESIYRPNQGKHAGQGPIYGDTGGASRFFFVAKVSPSERGDCTHPTMKPVELMRHLVRLVTPPGGTVLDPFLGSGSTGIAADREGFNFIGIEQSEDYAEQARKRIANDAPMLTAVEVVR